MLASKKLYGSEHAHTATKLLRVILDDKCTKADLYKVMETQCQHLANIQHNYLFK